MGGRPDPAIRSERDSPMSSSSRSSSVSRCRIARRLARFLAHDRRQVSIETMNSLKADFPAMIIDAFGHVLRDALSIFVSPFLRATEGELVRSG